MEDTRKNVHDQLQELIQDDEEVYGNFGDQLDNGVNDEEPERPSKANKKKRKKNKKKKNKQDAADDKARLEGEESVQFLRENPLKFTPLKDKLGASLYAMRFHALQL